MYSRDTNLPLSSCKSIDNPHLCNSHCAALNDGIETAEEHIDHYREGWEAGRKSLVAGLKAYLEDEE